MESRVEGSVLLTGYFIVCPRKGDSLISGGFDSAIGESNGVTRKTLTKNILICIIRNYFLGNVIHLL